MFRKLIIIISLSYYLISCTGPGRQPNVTISGEVPGFAGEMIYLEELEPLNAVLLDSAKITKKGTFDFKVYVDDAGFYVVRTQKENNLLMLLEKDELVTIRTTGNSFGPGTEIEGSPGTKLIEEFEVYMEYQRNRIDSLGMIYNASRGEEDFFVVKEKLDSLFLTYLEDQRKYVFRFIEDHPGSLASLILINRRLGQAEVINEESDFIYLYKIDSMLQLYHPGNRHTLDHHERVKALRGKIFDEYVVEEKLRPGKRAPDVVLPDTSGKPVSLKSFTGKQVILYFWAAWDARSREDNRKLVKIYSELQAQNIEVLGISLDENEVIWKGAIRLDQLQWPQLCDLKGFYSEVKRAYNVPDDLPYYYLIDADQKIKYKHSMLDSLLFRLN